MTTALPGYTARHTTYHLRPLRRKGFIRRIPRSQRYELTSEGLEPPVFSGHAFVLT